MRRPIIFVLIAGFAALVAAVVVYSALQKREAEIQRATIKSVDIVVATRDLPIGTKLDPSAVKLVRWSRDSVPPGSFTDPASVMNQYTKTNFVENEPIIGARLFSGDKNAGVLPLLIPAGMRAMAVPVDEVSDISGFVLPHTRVDVLISVANAGKSDKPFSKIVLQNVEVLAVAQDIETVQDKPQPVRVVTFLVTPDEAERLALASHEGTLRLAMRNYDDKKIVMTSGIDVQQMLRAYGGPQPEVPLMTPQPPMVHHTAVHHAEPVQVEVMRNGKSTENVSFVRHKGQSASSDGSTSEAESSNKVADNSPAPEANAGLTDSAAAHGALAAGTPPGESSLRAAIAHATGGEAPTAPANSGSHSKTIDVP